jgi:hypothetical protein
MVCVISKASLSVRVAPILISHQSCGLKAPRAVVQYNMVMSPMGLRNKKHCAFECQQQFTGLDCVSPLSLLGNGSVNAFPQLEKCLESSLSMQSIVSEKSRRSVLTRTSCVFYKIRLPYPGSYILC